jgi:hypothetical protein
MRNGAATPSRVVNFSIFGLLKFNSCPDGALLRR